MIPLEKRALEALQNCSMRIASNGKRFRNDMVYALERDPEFKFTKGQALFLWNLIYLYRRQVKDPELVRLGEHRKVYDELPEIYLEGDHREKQNPKRKSAQTVQL